VAAAIGTVIIGRKLPEAGTFAAALGLMIVSLRGGTMEFLLVRTADDSQATVRGLALKLAVEAVGWAFVVAMAVAASAIVSRWFQRPDEHRLSPEPDDDNELLLAGWDVPLLGTLLGRPRSCAGTSPADGMRHTAIATVVMLVAQRVFGTGLYDRVVTHGQACFVVAASACVGTYVAFRYAPVRSALWAILAALSTPVLGYLLAAITSGSSTATPALPVNIPPSHFMRALPIQGVAVGCAAAIATFWWPSVIEAAARVAVHSIRRGAIPR
jgi:hypothetical protein